MHETEAGKASLRMGRGQSWRKVCMGKRDDLAKFTCAPRHFVLASLFSF